ncbi:MAG: hypothetical protein ISS45_10415 [Candidatus Omnitrophica bacterium]|nr:hypothetical protein [Candidatus Omnitrophota bacterium]
MEQGESKNEKFKRIATKRVQNAISKIECIGNLSSSAYQYSQEEVDKIFSTLGQTLENTRKLFSPRQVVENKFEL